MRPASAPPSRERSARPGDRVARTAEPLVSAPGAAPGAPAWYAFALALIAGYVDGYALVEYDVFASFMSGNTTTGGMQVGMARLAEAAHDLLPIPLFVAGVVAGTSLMCSRLRRPATPLLALVAALLATAMSGPGFWGALEWPGVAILSLAMGILSAAIGRIGAQPVALGYVTGDLGSLGRHLALAARRVPLADARDPADTHARRATLLATIWATFLLGALLAGAVAPRFATWSLAPPIVVLLALAGVVPLGARPR